MKNDVKIMITFFIIGIVMGYASFMLNNPLMSTVLAFAVLFAAQKLFEKTFKIKEKIGWWMSNGGIVYIFVWFITWSLLLTL